MSTARKPGPLQGIMLLLPMTMAVMGISVLTPVVPLLLAQFKDAPYHEYLVIGGVLTMPAIWVMLFSPVAGWMADRLGRRNLLVSAMIVYAFVGIAPAFLDNLYAIIGARIAVGICESIVMTVSTTMISDYFAGHARERWLAGQTAVASVSALGIIYLGGSSELRTAGAVPFTCTFTVCRWRSVCWPRCGSRHAAPRRPVPRARRTPVTSRFHANEFSASAPLRCSRPSASTPSSPKMPKR